MSRMRTTALLLCLLLSALTATAQPFIGCRTDGGWAETPMLRTTFEVERADLAPVVGHSISFSLRVVSLGYHEVYLNGTRVGDWVLQPAVSQLDRRALEVEYDITDLVREGGNELMLWLGQGWGRIYGTPAVARAEVERTVSLVGSGEWIVDSTHGQVLPTTHYPLPTICLASTDSTWLASPSPYSYTGSWQPMQFGGERYDARVKESWRPAAVYEAENISVSQQEFEGNRIVDTLDPVGQSTLPDGSTLIDFGRVVTGWFYALYGLMDSGQAVTMEYLDHLEAKPPFTETDVFVSDGAPYNIFRNRFHMHAFRYVRVKGAGVGRARALQISAVDPAGGATFECSDPRLNAIHDMVKYTLSCLTFSGYMVDCPHLERMGYGGDGNSSTNTLQTLWDVRDVYANWMQAWHDALDSTGDLPYVAPAFRTGGGPYWQGFIVKAPWRTYLNYGDPTLIYRHYDDMCRWMDYVELHSEDGILQPWGDTERHSWFLADWLAPEGVDIGGESVLHASSCFIAECLADMEQMARMTRHWSDAERFAERRQRVVAAIHRHFYHPESHTYANGTPLDQAYALLMGVPPDSATAAAVKAQLIKDIHGRYRDHVAFGLMGTPVFTEWCIRERQTDLMATLLRQPDYPGYLHMIVESGKLKVDSGECVVDSSRGQVLPTTHYPLPTPTTWESWDCGRPGKEDRSRVHNCYNGIGTWFYQALAGIRPDSEQPGYKHFFIDPQPVEGVEWVRCTKPTPYGDIKVEVKREKSKVKSVKLVIPTGTTATVYPDSRYERTVGPGEYIIPLYQ